MSSTKLLINNPAPVLEVSTLDGRQWRLADQKTQNYTMVLFYRGWHCPFCQRQLTELDRQLERFANLGIEVIAVSSDTQKRALRAKHDWQLQNVLIGYGLSLVDMRRWGLYISKGAYEDEPAIFNEPAVFIVNSSGTLVMAIIGSTPFARPYFDDLIDGLDYIIKNNYPIRGTEV